MGIKIGVLGLGSFGGSFVPLFAAHPLVDAIALCDREPDRVKRWAEDPIVTPKLMNGGCCQSPDELCAMDLDAIAIITQPWLHAPQAIQALESGKDVYSAVPVICLPDDDEMLDWCGRIIDAVRRTGKNYMLGETTWYRPQTMFCRRKFQAGEFGKVVYAAAEYQHDVDSQCSLRQVKAARTASTVGKEYAGIMAPYYARGCKDHPMAYPTHSVSGPLSVMDTWAVKVSAYGVRNVFGADDPYFADKDFANIIALFQLANGVPCRIAECREVCYNTGLLDEDFRIFGTRGSYSYNQWNDNGRVTFNTDLKPVKKTKVTDEEMRDPLPPEVEAEFRRKLTPGIASGEAFTYGGHGGSHPYLVNEFVSSVFKRRRPAIDAWRAASYMAMGVAAHKSAMRDGEIVPVFDFGRPPSP